MFVFKLYGKIEYINIQFRMFQFATTTGVSRMVLENKEIIIKGNGHKNGSEIGVE